MGLKRKKSQERLTDNLEFTGLKNHSAGISQLKNINTPVQIFQTEIHVAGSIFYLQNFFAHEIEYLQSIGITI